jgi:hypothetical protein
VSGEEIPGNDVEGVLAFRKPWPSMARTVWGAHKRYMDTYLNVYKGYYVSDPPIFTALYADTLIRQKQMLARTVFGVITD